MGNLGTILPLIIMFVLFYFLLIRPQQKRQKSVQQMQNSLKKGDKIVTIGGLHGNIVSIDEKKAVIKCGNTNLTFDRSAIREVAESVQVPVTASEPEAELEDKLAKKD